MANTSAMIAELKRALREAQLTYRDVARHLSLSEASVKRMFASEQFSLHRVERILTLLRMDFADLIERVNERREYISQLSPEQEAALIGDERLMVIAFLALHRWRVEDIVAVYDYSEQEVQKQLIRLDRLKIIELLPFNRYRTLTARNFTWRRDGPVQQYFATHIQKEFFESSFEDRSEALRFVAGPLSREGIRQMHRAIHRIAAEFDELAERDSRLPLDERASCSAAFAIRPVEFSVFARQRRDSSPRGNVPAEE